MSSSWATASPRSVAAERAGEVDGRQEAVRGADRVDLEACARGRSAPSPAPASAIVADRTRPSPSARTITWPQAILRTVRAVAGVLDEPAGIGGHPRARAQPVAPARRLHDGHDLGAPACQLRRDRQQERAGAGQQHAAARARRPGPWPAPARRRRSSRPGSVQPGKATGGRRRRWPARRPRRAPRARSSPSAAARPARARAHTDAPASTCRAGGGELARSARARRAGSERGASSPTSSKRRRQICPPGAAYSSISTTDAPARAAARAAVIPAGPPPTTATSTYSSITRSSVRAPQAPTYRQLSNVARPRFAICRNSDAPRLTGPPHPSRTLIVNSRRVCHMEASQAASGSRRGGGRRTLSVAAPALAQTPPVIDTTGGKTAAGVRLRGRDPRAGVHRVALRLRQQQRQGHHRDRHQAPEGHQRGPEGAGDHGPEPVLLDARARQRVPAQARLRRRRPARPVAAVLRQLLRPARLRRDPDGHDRDQQLDRAARPSTTSPTTSARRS